MIEIDFTAFQKDLRLTRQADSTLVFDPIRRRNIVLQPEELVRQLVLQYLLQKKGYKLSQIRVEFGLKVNELQKRCDILIFNVKNNLLPFLLVECKSIHVPVDQAVFEQIARYNIPLRVPYLVVTNGLVTFAAHIDFELQSFNFLDFIPGADAQ